MVQCICAALEQVNELATDRQQITLHCLYMKNTLAYLYADCLGITLHCIAKDSSKNQLQKTIRTHVCCKNNHSIYFKHL